MAEHLSAAASDQPLLVGGKGWARNYGRLTACRDVSFAPLSRRGARDRPANPARAKNQRCCKLLSAQLTASAGRVSYRMRERRGCAISPRSARPSAVSCSVPTGVMCIRTPRLGLRMAVSAGANVGGTADGGRLEIITGRHPRHRVVLAGAGRDRCRGAIDDCTKKPIPAEMRQRLQIARQSRHRNRGWCSWMNRTGGPRCVGAGAACSISCAISSVSLHLAAIVRHPRSCGGTAIVASGDGDEGRPAVNRDRA